VRATFRYVLLTAVRDRFPVAILVALLAMTAASFLVSASTLEEGRQTGLAFASELYRTVLVLGLVIFVSFHVRGLHESREIEAILTRPVSRASFVVAYYGAFAALAAVLALLTAPLLAAVLGASGAGLGQWEASMVLESWIVVALALFCAMALGSGTAAVLVALGLYVLGRTAQYFLAIASSGSGASSMEGVNRGSEAIMSVIATVMPRIDLFGQSRWLIYGPGGDWGVGILLLQAAIYIPLLLIATVRDLHVRRF
jgi:hypothetical protein